MNKVTKICRDVCEQCGTDWPDIDYPGCKNPKCGHDMSVNRKEYERRREEKMNKEAKHIVNLAFEKTAKEKKKRNVTARALGSAALGTVGGLAGSSALAHETKVPVGLASKAGAALGALAAGGTSIAKNVRHNRKIEEKAASELINNIYETINK